MLFLDSEDENSVKEILDLMFNKKFEIILNRIRENSEAKYILLKGYYLAYISHSNINNSKYYFELKDFLFKKVDEIPISVVRDFVEILNSFSSDST
ncbi:MAG: hypothetical protein WBP08_11825, partial [Saprospiraceae bacterium]